MLKLINERDNVKNVHINFKIDLISMDYFC